MQHGASSMIISGQLTPGLRTKAAPQVLTISSRDSRLDALRGLLLLIMAGVHVPSPLSHLVQEPFGFTSAAEGFVFLGACLAGFAYGKVYFKAGWRAMAKRVWGRTRIIYFVHLGLVIPMALLALALSGTLTPLAHHFHDFLKNPGESLALMPLLLHQPPLFDILPLYVIFLGATPLVLGTAQRYGWGLVLGISALGWMMAQANLNFHWLGDSAALRLGSFNLLAWQFLWVAGLAVGKTSLQRPILSQKSRRTFGIVAGSLVMLGLVSRHFLSHQGWFPADLFLWMDKWTLGPLRLLNFSALVVFLMAWNPRMPDGFSPLVLLGRHSLSVFALHIPLAVGATVILQTYAFPAIGQTVIGLLVVLALFPCAVLLEMRARPRKSTEKAPAFFHASPANPNQQRIRNFEDARLHWLMKDRKPVRHHQWIL